MPRPRRIEPEVLQPIDETMFRDEQGIAGEFGDVLDALAGFDASAIKGFLYRKPANGIGKYEIIEEVQPPFDMAAIVSDLKERFNGGDFQLRLLANGRVRKNIDFSIVKERASVPVKDDRPDTMTAMMFQMMMEQNREAARQRSEDARERAAAAERQTNMMVSFATALIPAMLGGKDKTSEVMTALAPFIARKEEKSSLQETIATITAVKGLFPNPETPGGLDFDNLAETGLKFAGPMIGAIGKAFERRGPQQPIPNQLYDTPGQGGGHLALNPPAGPPGSRVDGAPEPAPALAAPDMPPLLRLIAPDIAYYFARRGAIPADVAADCIYDVISAADVPEDQFDELAAAFAVSPDWLADLARYGLDLRGDPEWARRLLAALVAIHADAEPQRGGDDPERQGGDAGDLAGDDEAGQGRFAVHDGAGQGGGADHGGVPERARA